MDKGDKIGFTLLIIWALGATMYSVWSLYSFMSCLKYRNTPMTDTPARCIKNS